MADASIDLQATDLFAMDSTFKIQSSTTSDPTTNPANLDSLGNVSCERTVEDITNYSQSASYCGTLFSSALSAGGHDRIGNVVDSKAYTSLTVNMTAGEYCTVDLEGHNHAENAHATSLPNMDIYKSGGILNNGDFVTWDGFGVPATDTNEYFGITCTNASPASATLTCTVNHTDQIAEDGTHLVGTNTTGRVELSIDFSGLPDGTSVASLEGEIQALGGDWAGFLVDSVDLNDSNSDFDSLSLTGHVHLALV